MKVEVDGRVQKIAKRDNGVWYVQIRVNKHFIQTYTGFTKRPNVKVRQVIHKGDEIE